MSVRRDAVGIYCSGGIRKGPEDDGKLIWGDAERAAIARAVAPIEAVFLNPNDRSDDLSDAFTVFGRDHYQLKVADVCVVDARQRRGIGVGIEMLSAKRLGKPVVSVAAAQSHYRRDRLTYLGGEVVDYMHAHLFGVSDVIVDDFNAAGEWIRKYLESPVEVKDVSVVDAAIAAYQERQLERDVPMQDALRRLSGRS